MILDKRQYDMTSMLATQMHKVPIRLSSIGDPDSNIGSAIKSSYSGRTLSQTFEPLERSLCEC